MKAVPVLCYSRVSGYYNPTVNFNKGKREEFAERKMMNISEFIHEKIVDNGSDIL